MNNNEYEKATQPKTLDEKLKVLNKISKEFEKRFSDSKTNIKLGSEYEKVDFYSTGLLGIDLVLGGGIAKKRIIGISGSESSGKTTLALTTIATAMREDKNLMAYYYDAENSIDREYAKNLGVDLARLVIDTDVVAENGLTKLREAMKSGIFSIAVLDSTNALCAGKNVEDDISAVTMGLRARLLSEAYPQLQNACYIGECTLIVIEQFRAAIGVMYGDPTVTTVGNSGKYAMSQRLTMRRQTKVAEEDGIAVSNDVKVKCIKNKVAPPFRYCDLTCLYGKGFDNITDIANLAVELEIIEKSGAWLYYPNKQEATSDNSFQGSNNFKNKLKEDKDFYNEISKKVLDKYHNTDKDEVMQDKDTSDIDNEKKSTKKKLKELQDIEENNN